MLVYNARKRGQKAKTLEKSWLLPPRKIISIEGKTAVLEGMKGKVNVLNLKLVPERLSKEDFDTEHGNTAREEEKWDEVSTVEKSVAYDHSCNMEDTACSSLIATGCRATKELKEEERNSTQHDGECCTDECELAMIKNNGTSSTIVRCINHNPGKILC